MKTAESDPGQRAIYRRIQLTTIALPAVAVVLLLASVLVLETAVSAGFAVLVTAALATVGIVIFSAAVFSALEPLRARLVEQNQQLARNADRLQAVYNAGIAITSNLSLDAVLQRVVDASRSVVKARYGALAILDETGAIVDFITSGLSREDMDKLVGKPEGHGLIGKVLQSGKPYRTADIANDPNSIGVPSTHPPMSNFLGVPLSFKGRVIGHLYLANKENGEFSQEDQDTLHQAFAAQAAIAIENARLYEQVQDVAVLQERERIGMDLHDGTIQAIYGVGLQLEDCISRVESEPAEVKQDLDAAIEHLNGIIKDIRNYIFDLRPLSLQGSDLVGAIRELAMETKVNTLMTVDFNVNEPDRLDALSEFQASQLFAIAHEALANVRKHAHARNVTITLEPAEGNLRLVVADDGNGMSGNGHDHPTGRGLGNMTDRAAALSGRLDIESNPGHGTTLTVDIPFTSGATPAGAGVAG